MIILFVVHAFKWFFLVSFAAPTSSPMFLDHCRHVLFGFFKDGHRPDDFAGALWFAGSVRTNLKASQGAAKNLLWLYYDIAGSSWWLPSLEQRRPRLSNELYSGLKYELMEIKSLLNELGNSSQESDVLTNSLRDDILEVKDMIKGTATESSQITENIHDDQTALYNSMSILTPGEYIIDTFSPLLYHAY